MYFQDRKEKKKKDKERNKKVTILRKPVVFPYSLKLKLMR